MKCYGVEGFEKKTHLERKTETKVKNDRLWNARWKGKKRKNKN